MSSIECAYHLVFQRDLDVAQLARIVQPLVPEPAPTVREATKEPEKKTKKTFLGRNTCGLSQIQISFGEFMFFQSHIGRVTTLL